MSVKKKRTIGPCRGVTWLYYVVLLWSRDFFLSLYLDPRFRPLLLKCNVLADFIRFVSSWGSEQDLQVSDAKVPKDGKFDVRRGRLQVVLCLFWGNVREEIVKYSF